MVGFLYNGLGLALLPALYALGRTFSPPQIVRDWRSRFLLLWLLPPLAFYVLVHIGNPGYVLSFLPPLCIYSAMATFVFFEDLREAAALLGAGRPWPAALAAAPRRAWVAPAATATVLAIGAVNAGAVPLRQRRGAPPRDQPDRPHPGAPAGRDRSAATRPLRASSSPTTAPGSTATTCPGHKIELLFDVAVAGAVTDTSRYWERRQVFRVPPGWRPCSSPT